MIMVVRSFYCHTSQHQRKRTREADLNDCTDCLPLSKRINSLTIDNSVPIPPQALFHINVNVEQNHTHNVIGQDWQPSVQSSEYLPGPSYINENHNHVPHFPTSNWSQSSSNGLNQQSCHVTRHSE
ncbi:hypothetical protein M8J75_015447 [Diaphorina citri]|nr:hypothetical protein M8J75_015447 [Diaphorina citri]